MTIYDANIKEYKIKNDNYIYPILYSDMNLTALIIENFDEIIDHGGNSEILVDMLETGVYDVFEAAQAYVYLQYIIYNIKPSINGLYYIGNKAIHINFSMNKGIYHTEINLLIKEDKLN
jgi:hypothetical protein